MSKDNKASRIIVSSMTLIEVGDFLKETVFSSDAISKLEERVDKKNKDYEKAYKVWLYNHDENEFCKIFNPIRYKGTIDRQYVGGRFGVFPWNFRNFAVSNLYYKPPQ